MWVATRILSAMAQGSGGSGGGGEQREDVQRESGQERVPTWRDGVELSAAQKTALTPEQLRQYTDDSVVKDLAEIDAMPEPLRSRVRALVDRSREHAEARIAAQEGCQTS